MAVLIEPRARANHSTAGYFAVQVDMLRRLSNPPVDLFVQYEVKSPLVLYHRAGAPLDPAQLDRLTKAGNNRIYIRSDDFRRFGSHLLETVDTLVEHEAVPA